VVPILRDVLAEGKYRVIPELAEPAIPENIASIDAIIAAEAVEV
jgi:hypothetical protein